MKQIGLIVFVFSLTPMVWSQDITFYSSVKGNIFGSTIMNRSITDDQNQNYTFALAGSGGVGGSFFFSPRKQALALGLSFDFLYGNHKASYIAEGLSIDGNQASFQSNVSFQSLHIPLLLNFYILDEKKRHPEAYFQIGTQFNTCVSPTYTFDDFSSDVSEYYSNNYWSGILSFGRVGQIVNDIRFHFGLRIEYGFGGIGGINAYGVPLNNSNGLNTRALGIGFDFGISYEIGDLRNI